MKHALGRASALAAVLAVAVACSPGTPGSASTVSGTAEARPAATAKSPVSPAATFSALAACKALAVWENSDDSESVANDANPAETFQNTSQPLSSDFSTWALGIKSGGANDNVNADRVSSDCAALGVPIFPPVPGSETSATPAPTPSQTVTFEVSGSNAQVTYGPAGSSLSGTVPMTVTQKLGDPLYYSLQAQLQGGGSITVKILVNGAVISQGTASGGYNIAMAEISQDPLSGAWASTQG